MHHSLQGMGLLLGSCLAGQVYRSIYEVLHNESPKGLYIDRSRRRK